MKRKSHDYEKYIPSGKQLFLYDPARFSATRALQTLVETETAIEPGTVTRITVREDDSLFWENVSIRSIHDLPEDDLIRNGFPRIGSVGFTYPVLASDRRWDTIHLTASSLFIGSGLTDTGFDVTVKKQPLPATTVAPELLACDLMGFTLFEDLFTGTLDLLTALREKHGYRGLIAAGGPMSTLTPLQTAFHLPGINLVVRGEAETVFPFILDALNRGDWQHLFSHDGFLFHIPGMLILSGLDFVHHPGNEELERFCFNLDFVRKEHLSEGLEINLSRGCRRGCVFCSAVQGKTLRKLPVSTLDQLLDRFAAKLDRYGLDTPRSRTVNINDDDMLQDPFYTRSVMECLKSKNFRLWGVQTSIHSFFKTPEQELPADVTAKDERAHKEIDESLIRMVADKAVYVDNNPLVWCGTDAFLRERGKRLGKWIPDEHQFVALLEQLEKNGIRHFHYWISSDHGSTWMEFTRELMWIHRLHTQFPLFGLIAHSPFLVPYATTPVYRLLTSSRELEKRIEYKLIPKSPHPAFDFPLADRVETGFRHLNRLLNSEKLENRLGFFDYLSQKDWANTFITVYNFLKQERLQAESATGSSLVDELMTLEREMENVIGSLL